MTCSTCHNQVPPGDKFCQRCGTAVAIADDPIFVATAPGEDADQSDVGPPGDRAAFPLQGIPPRPLVEPPVRPPFALAMDERVLKLYEAVQLRKGLFRRKRGQGTLFVTDARVVFYAWVYPRGTQRESWLFQQTKLEDISGLSAHVSRRISPMLLLLSIFFSVAAIVGLIAAIEAPAALAAFVVFGILAAVCIIGLISSSSRRGDVGVVIHSRENENSPIVFGHGARTWSPGMLGWALIVFLCVLILPLGIFVLLFSVFRSLSAWDVVEGDPAADADRLIGELGALILDLQERGKLAYSHWGIAPRSDAASGVGVGERR